MKLLLFLSASALLFGATKMENWKLEKDKEGIQVYTRAVDWSNTREFKGVSNFSSSLQQLVGIMKDPSHYSYWMFNTSDCKLVKTVNENDFYTYAVNEAPWPVSDRDNVTRMQISYPSPNIAVIKMTAAPDMVPEKDGVVRIKEMSGYWQFEDLGNGKILVTQQVHCNPGGNVPSWLVNSSIVDNPFNTIKGMRKWAQGG